jgi:hypothetical protein
MVASLGVAWLYAQHDPGAAFYLITTRFWQLASGVLLYLCIARWSTPVGTGVRGRVLASSGAWLSLLLLGWSLWSSVPADFPFPGGWMPVVATLGLLGFLYWHPDTLPGRALRRPLMIAIGKRSYSLYLWHWPVLALLRWTSGVESPWALAAASVLTVASAELSYRYVEAPLRYSPRLRQWTRLRVLTVGTAALAACALLSLTLIKGRPWFSLSTVTRNEAEWYPEALQSLDEVPRCRLQKDRSDDGSVQARIYTRNGCTAPSGPVPRIFALGDSHALAYITLLSEHVLRTGGEVVLYPNPECSFANLRTPGPDAACETQAQSILEDIARRADSGDILFLAALRLNRFSDQDGNPPPFDVMESMRSEAASAIRAQARTRLRAQLQPLRAQGIRIVFEAPKPVLPAPPFRCSDIFNAGNPDCRGGLGYSRQSLLAYRAPVMIALRQLSVELGSQIWDPFPVLCPQAECTAALDGHPLYFDGDHISGYANRLMYASFAEFLAGQPRR